MYQSEAVTEIDEVKVLWNCEIRTDRTITARRPDIVIADKGNKTATIIDPAFTSDNNIKIQERDKIERYQDFGLEMQSLWNVKSHVPIVLGIMRSSTLDFQIELEEMADRHKSAALLKAAFLRTTSAQNLESTGILVEF